MNQHPNASFWRNLTVHRDVIAPLVDDGLRDETTQALLTLWRLCGLWSRQSGE